MKNLLIYAFYELCALLLMVPIHQIWLAVSETRWPVWLTSVAIVLVILFAWFFISRMFLYKKQQTGYEKMYRLVTQLVIFLYLCVFALYSSWPNPVEGNSLWINLIALYLVISTAYSLLKADKDNHRHQ